MKKFCFFVYSVDWRLLRDRRVSSFRNILFICIYIVYYQLGNGHEERQIIYRGAIRLDRQNTCQIVLYSLTILVQLEIYREVAIFIRVLFQRRRRKKKVTKRERDEVVKSFQYSIVVQLYLVLFLHSLFRRLQILFSNYNIYYYLTIYLQSTSLRYYNIDRIDYNDILRLFIQKEAL